jgi:hypothetical protein
VGSLVARKLRALQVAAVALAISPGVFADPPTGSAPPAPDYAQLATWAAWPGRPSAADTLAPGLADASLPESERVDVFFIHPTTYLTGSEPNAHFDERGITSAQVDRGVLRFQASVFNACCRIYAPRYRQATIRAFTSGGDARSQAAFELAYSDVLRAFEYYLEHENHGRPFIIASHSQGSLHALRLLQERVAGKPLQSRLVAAYVIGYSIPQQIERTGLPVCRSATQTGCLIDWNTVKEGANEDSRQRSRLIWLDGRYQHHQGSDWVCVNPLNWKADGDAPASLNLGALPGVRAGTEMRAPVAELTGARCDGGLLRVDIPFSKRHGFANVLTLLGSYHVFDYNLFYTNIRFNVRDRIRAFGAASHSTG